MPRLREDVEEAQAEVSRAQEQEQMKQIEVAELQRQRNELRQQLHEAEEAHRAVSNPMSRMRASLCITACIECCTQWACSLQSPKEKGVVTAGQEGKTDP